MGTTDNGSPGHFTKDDIGYQGFVKKMRIPFERGTRGSLNRWIFGAGEAWCLCSLAGNVGDRSRRRCMGFAGWTSRHSNGLESLKY